MASRGPLGGGGGGVQPLGTVGCSQEIDRREWMEKWKDAERRRNVGNEGGQENRKVAEY